MLDQPAPAPQPRLLRRVRVDGEPAWRWDLSFDAPPARPASGRFVLAVGALACSAATGAWMAGFPWLPAFCLTVFVASVVALFGQVRSVRGHDTVTLTRTHVVVELRRGDEARSVRFQAPWLRVENVVHAAGKVVLSDLAHRVELGHRWPSHLRSRFAQKLRRALAEGDAAQPEPLNTAGRAAGRGWERPSGARGATGPMASPPAPRFQATGKARR